eukprot:7418126-Pyramimonas_sp.AAC.1
MSNVAVARHVQKQAVAEHMNLAACPKNGCSHQHRDRNSVSHLMPNAQAATDAGLAPSYS